MTERDELSTEAYELLWRMVYDVGGIPYRPLEQLEASKREPFDELLDRKMIITEGRRSWLRTKYFWIAKPTGINYIKEREGQE